MTSAPDQCWASPVGACDGGPSREHIISASQFNEKSINIKGLPWCKESKPIGLAGLVAKNLCRKHNSALSVADDEALKLKLALRGMTGARHPDITINARMLERWLLKTSINITMQEPGSGLVVTPALARRAFGRERTPRRQGFFFAAEVTERVGGRDGEFGFETLCQEPDGAVVRATFQFHGWRLVYAFAGAPPVTGAQRVRHLQGARSVYFAWSPGFDPGDGRMK
jgi:hypothetical protein